MLQRILGVKPGFWLNGQTEHSQDLSLSIHMKVVIEKSHVLAILKITCLSNFLKVMGPTKSADQLTMVHELLELKFIQMYQLIYKYVLKTSSCLKLERAQD